MLTGLEGFRTVKMPKSWSGVYAKLQRYNEEAIRGDALRLALKFDDPTAYLTLRKIAADARESKANRTEAVEALVQKKPDDLPGLLLKLIRDPATQDAALHGLAEYTDPKIGATILSLFPALSEAGRRSALLTLASRRDWAMALLDQVEAKEIKASDLSAYTARQLENLDDPKVTARLKSLWGNVRPTPAEKTRLIAKYRKRLSADTLSGADRQAGRAIFQKTCANCHTLFGEGGKIGPDITGAADEPGLSAANLDRSECCGGQGLSDGKNRHDQRSDDYGSGR